MAIDLDQIMRALPSQQLRDFRRQEYSATALIREALEPDTLRLARAACESPLVDPFYASLQGRLSDWIHSDLFRAQTVAGMASSAAIERQRMRDQLREYQTPQTIADLFFDMHDMSLRVSDAAARARQWLNPFHDLVRGLHLWPERVEKCLLAMAQAGWHPDEELLEDGLFEIEQILEEEGPERLDAFMVGYVRDALDRIETVLVMDHPDRELFIRGVFAAHREGKYFHAVLAALVLADGIFADITGHELFSGNGAGRYAKGLEAATVERAYMAPLNHQSRTPLFHSAQQRSQVTRKMLSRNAVLHGENIDYTEELSLQAISVLAFVSAALLRVQEAKAA